MKLGKVAAARRLPPIVQTGEERQACATGRRMSEMQSALAIFAILSGSAAAGLGAQRFLSEKHMGRETRDLSQAVTGMLVTLAALVLGLLTSSVKQSFDQVAGDLRMYAVEIIELGQSLHALGPDAAPAHAQLRQYVADAIATTWSDEPKPRGATDAVIDALAGTDHPPIENATLGAALEQVRDEIRRLPRGDAERSALVATASAQIGRLIEERWLLIEEARSSVPKPFYRVLVFWLMIVFASLGLIAPRNVLATAMLALAALAIALVVFAILEIDTPLGGQIEVSSAPLRDALAHLSE